jgi:3-methyladenine DNA glycosylase AlkD
MSPNPSAEAVLARLKSLANPDNVAGMARYGINTQNTLGISIYTLRPIAKEIGRNHALALQLWDSGIHEARILASYIDDPLQVTADQMERWVAEFDSWDVCDQVCELFAKTSYAYQKIFEWSGRSEEFVKRTAFALIAELSAHDKNAPDEKFAAFFPIILRESTDERNFVKKAVNWALRNIGKRNSSLNAQAIVTAQQIKQIDSRSARWIASDTLRELTGEKVQSRLRKTAY